MGSRCLDKYSDVGAGVPSGADIGDTEEPVLIQCD